VDVSVYSALVSINEVTVLYVPPGYWDRLYTVVLSYISNRNPDQAPSAPAGFKVLTSVVIHPSLKLAEPSLV